MYNCYSAFAQTIRAKSAFPSSLLSASSPPSDQDFLQNPYYNPNPNHRLHPLLNGYFSRQSALLYWAPSRTFLAAAATYLATTRRSQVKLSHCTASTSSRSCCVTVRETRCCHSHCFCDQTSFRETRSCNKGRGQKILEREVTQARQVWRCNADYECNCDRSELIERDVKRREKSLEPRVSDNTRIEEYHDYQEIDNSRRRDDNSRNFNRRRRDDCEYNYEDNRRIRFFDQRGRRDERDNRFSDRRRRAEYDYEDNERRRLADQRRSRDEHDDKFRSSDRRRRAEYDDYEEVEDARNRDDRIRVSDREKKEEYDFEEVDNYRRRADQIKFTDQKRNNVYNERDDRIKVSDRRRRDESYNIHGEDKVRVSDQRRRDEYFDYGKEDKIRVSDQQRREDYNERADKIRVSDRKEESYNYADKDNEMRREDRIRVSDRRGREVHDERDNKLRVSDRRRQDAYYDYNNEDNIRAYDRRMRNEHADYDNDDKIRVFDRRRRDEYYDFDGEDKVRVSDRRSDGYYDYDDEDKIRVSDRRRRDVYYDFNGEDKVRVYDRRRKEIYDERDNRPRVMDKRRRDEDDKVRVADQRRRDEDYDYEEEEKSRVFDQKRKEVLSKKDDKISILDHRSREEADDYEELFTNLQQRGSATRVSDPKLERQSRFKEARDEASTSQIRQTDERAGKYREEREHYDQKSSKEGSQIVKIISEDDSSLVYRERKNAVTKLLASDAQLNLQSQTNIGRQEQRIDSSTSVQSQVAVDRDKYNTLNAFTVSEVETDVQNRTHISTGRNQVDTSSSVQNQVQILRDKKNIINELAVSETELDVQNRSNVDVQRKMVDTSSTVQNVTQVARDKKNVLNQLTVSEVESDLQDRSQIEAERRRVDASTSVQNVAEFTKKRHNVVNQSVSEAESDVQNRTHIEAERRRIDASTSVQNVTQVVRDKHNIVNQLTMSEVESNVQNINRIEAERRKVDLDTSVLNATQVASERQKIVDQLAVSEVESDAQKNSRTEAERRMVDTATAVHNVTQVTKEKSNVVNQLVLHETEVNVLNKTDVNLTRVHVNDASTITDNLSTGTGSGTSCALIQATGSSSKRVGSSSLVAGPTSFKGSLESASRLEKSSSYHVGRFVDSVHEELLGGSERKDPSDNLLDLKSSGSCGTSKTAASASTEAENSVSRRHGRSLWAFVADIIKLGFLKGEAGQLKSARRSSSSDSRGTDDWFSGQEEMDLEVKNDDGKMDGQPLFEFASEVGPSALVKVPEVDFSITDDGTVIPNLQEKTVVEEVRGHESTSSIGETHKFSSSTTSGVHASGVVGTALSLGEKIVTEEIPKIAKHIAEQSSSDLPARVAAGEINASAATSSSLLEAHINRVTESGEKGESKREKQIKRIMQVPKSSFDEWEEEHSTEIETPAIDSTGVTRTEVLASGVTRVPDVSTSLGTATLELRPSEVIGHPSASASSTSTTLHVRASGETGIEAAGGLNREKQLKRIAQVQNKSIDEYRETKVGESTIAASESTAIIAKLPESGAVEGHESIDKGSRKHLRRLSQAPRESFEEWEEAYIREKEQRRLDEFFMREALVEAQRASESWEVPVGAVLVRNGEVIARGCNLVEELRDSTAHAEIVCIREASNFLHSWRLSDTTLYVTLEPCAMCAGAILQARIDTVVWGAPNKLLGADGSWVRLFPGDTGTSSSMEPPQQQSGPVHPFHPKIAIRRGILEEECSEIMQQFFKLRRKKKNTKPETSKDPSCLPAHPLKFFSRFTGMFCI